MGQIMAVESRIRNQCIWNGQVYLYLICPARHLMNQSIDLYLSSTYHRFTYHLSIICQLFLSLSRSTRNFRNDPIVAHIPPFQRVPLINSSSHLSMHLLHSGFIWVDTCWCNSSPHCVTLIEKRPGTSDVLSEHVCVCVWKPL